MKKSRALALTLIALSTFAGLAHAHVATDGRLTAGANTVLKFGVGHGCEGADTVRVRIEIPESVTSVRGLTSAWGEGTFERDATDRVVAVTFEKAAARDQDDQYYEFALRLKAPAAPFTTLYFPTTQTCRDAAGEELTVKWSDPGGHDAESPAPSAMVFPARSPGWNRYVVPVALHDLSVFDDARIVWAGTAAYSSNTETAALITSDPDVSALSAIEANQEIWVLY